MGMVYVNGRFVSKEEATVSVYDHGFLYGDGVFEGIRCYNGRVFKLTEHVDRMFESAATLRLEIPMTRAEMSAAIVETVRRTGLRDAYIRPVVSRGPGDLGIDPRKCPKANVVIIVDSIQLYPEEAYRKGLRVITASTRQRPLVNALADVSHYICLGMPRPLQFPVNGLSGIIAADDDRSPAKTRQFEKLSQKQAPDAKGWRAH